MYKKDTHLRAVVDGGAGAGVNHVGGLGRGLASALVDACVHTNTTLVHHAAETRVLGPGNELAGINNQLTAFEHNNNMCT